jgi:hypothetical protein
MGSGIHPRVEPELEGAFGGCELEYRERDEELSQLVESRAVDF